MLHQKKSLKQGSIVFSDFLAFTKPKQFNSQILNDSLMMSIHTLLHQTHSNLNFLFNHWAVALHPSVLMTGSSLPSSKLASLFLKNTQVSKTVSRMRLVQIIKSTFLSSKLSFSNITH